MPDLPDILSRPHPDQAHEALRLGLVQAIERLSTEVERLNGALLLLQVTADFAQSTLNTSRAARAQLASAGSRLDALEAGGADIRTAVAELTARIAVLEGPKLPDAREVIGE